MDELNIQDKLDGFYGTYEVFQESSFAEIFARHHHLNQIDLNGMKVFTAKRRLFKKTKSLIYSPEKNGSFEQWGPLVASLKADMVEIHTCRKIEFLNKYCSSAPDNYVVIFDLSGGKEKLFNGFNKKCRESIRNGSRKGVKIRPSKEKPELKRFYEIALGLSGNGKKFSVPCFAFFEDLFESEYAALIVATHQDEMIGGYFLLLTSNVFAWMGGFDRRYSHLTPGNLMYYETMNWAIEKGYHYLQVGDQSLSQNEALAKFKLSFNPILIPAYVYNVPISRVKILLMEMKKNEMTRKQEEHS